MITVDIQDDGGQVLITLTESERERLNVRMQQVGRERIVAYITREAERMISEALMQAIERDGQLAKQEVERLLQQLDPVTSWKAYIAIRSLVKEEKNGHEHPA